MSLENEYIGPEDEVQKEPKVDKSKKKPKKAVKTTGEGIRLTEIFSRIDPKKSKAILGSLFLVLSFFVFLSCFSYLFTWQIDQNRLIGKSFFEFIFSGEEEAVENWVGNFGAWTSHLLVYRWFGLTSFAFSLIFFLSGVRLLFNISLLPIGKTIVIASVFMVWGSVLLGYYPEKAGILGGNVGYFVNHWLSLTLGKFGALVLILAAGYVFSVLLFHDAFMKFLSWIGIWKRRKGKLKEEEQVEGELMDEYEMAVINTLRDEDKEEDLLAQTLVFDEPEDNELEEDDSAQEETIIEDDFVFEIAEGEDEMLPEYNDDDEAISSDIGEYDPKLDLSTYTLPSIELLKDFGTKGVSIDKAELESNKNKIVETLAHYKIEIAKIMATVGPTVTLYEIVPAPGVRISKIKNLEDDIALSLSALGIRIIAPIPGKGTIGIEVPNSKPDMVSMRSLIASKKFQESDFDLPVVIGKTITNETFAFDLTKMPHLLVAGATGQGKSVGLNAILISILYKKHPSQVKFVLVDPKKVELTLYNKIERHFLAKLPGEGDAIITDTSKVVNTLNSLTIEMDDRYELLKQAHVRTIKEYNTKFIARKLNPEKGHRYLPYIVVLIDEFADLIITAGKEVEQPIARLAQLARAIGIHLIVATQRPSVNVITGMIKANFPARIAFRVLSKIDSRTILDASGADQLIGRGDMLFSAGQDIVRLQCGFVDTPEVEAICEFIGDQRGYPEAFMLPEFVGETSEGNGSMDDEELDPLFADSARIVVMHQQGSASLLQRKLKLGYNRAGRLIDQLEAMGIIGPFKGSKARDVLFSDEVSLEHFLSERGLN